MKTRFILGQLKTFGMVIICFFIFPFVTFPKRRKIWAMQYQALEDRKWYWKFSDTSETGFGTEEKNYLNSTYGIYELTKKRNKNGVWEADYEKFATFGKLRKWFLSFHWLVFRNGAWNYIVSNVPKQGTWENVECKVNIGKSECMTWRDKKIHGTQSITWEVDGIKYFRESFTRKAKWYNVQRLGAFIFSFKWHKYYNFMWGAASNRFLLKSRTFNIEDN